MRKVASLLPVLMLTSALAFGQARTITGVIRDSNGNPVPFASVAEAGKKTGTTTDQQGRFTINANKGAVLVVSAVNFKSQQVAISDRTAYDVALENSMSTMDEVIVTAGGIK